MASHPSAPAGIQIISVLRETPRPVYLAKDPVAGSQIHLKEARNRTAALREARALTRVAGPFTPRFIRLLREDTTYWIAVEWIDGIPLSQAPPSGAAWPADLIRAIVHLHRWGVVHGDLKPGNLLQRSDGTFCVVDFEMASRAGEEVALEETGGTRGYVAPERLSGWPADPRSDLYSLGVTLRSMPNLPPAMTPFLQQLLAESPGQRPTASDVLLSEVVEAVGLGSVAHPDLALTGWRGDRISTERFAAGIRAHLGCDPASSWKLAQELHRASGETRRVAERLWSRWLPEVTADPWQPTEAERLRRAMGRLHELALEESGTWYQEAPTDARKAAAFLAQIGESFATEETDRLVRIVGNRSDCQEEGGVLQQVDDRIEELLDTGVLRRVDSPNVDPSASLRFANKEIWGVAQNSLDSQLARQVHRALAEEIESDLSSIAEPSPDSLDNLAWHWDEAGEEDRARDTWFGAGIRAFNRGENEKAARSFDRGWIVVAGKRSVEGRQVPRIPTREQIHSLPRASAIGLLDDYSSALTFSDRLEESRQWLDYMSELGTEGWEKAAYHRCKAQLSSRMRQSKEVLSHVQAGFAEANGDPKAEGRLHFIRSQTLIADLSQLEDGVAAAEKACMLLEQVSDYRFLSNALVLLGLAYYQQSEFEEAKKILEKSLDVSRQGDNRFQQAAALGNLAAVEGRLGHTEAALSRLHAAIDISSENGYRDVEMSCAHNLAHLAQMSQEWDVGLQHAAHAADLAMESGRAANIIRTRLELIHHMIGTGRIIAAERICVESIRFGKEDVPVQEVIGVMLALLQCRAWFRDAPLEAESMQEIESSVAEGGNPFQTELALIFVSLNRMLLGERPEDLLPNFELPPKNPPNKPWFHLVKARLTNATDNTSEALSLLAEAGRVAPNDRFISAITLLEEARFLRATHPSKAMDKAAQARELARAIRSRWVEAQSILLLACGHSSTD